MFPQYCTGDHSFTPALETEGLTSHRNLRVSGLSYKKLPFFVFIRINKGDTLSARTAEIIQIKSPIKKQVRHLDGKGRFKQ